ncbi:MAG: cytochrome c peroxidase [Bacteroidota bacterium]
MKKILVILSTIFFFASSCEDKKTDVPCSNCPDTELIDGPYNPQQYTFNLPSWLVQKPLLPENDTMTIAGVELGRYLFYDPILSADNTLSCASCHQQDKAFTDGSAVSVGIRGIPGTRSAMPIFNLAFNPREFFWDGRVHTLETQALLPITDPLEMDDTWENVMERLRNDEDYPQLFRAAFGIKSKQEMTKELAVNAIAQFERSIVSFESRYDRILQFNEGWPTDEELRGQTLFFIEPFMQTDNHPGCSHCHNGPNFTNHTYSNNGLDKVDDLNDFVDRGRGAVTNNLFDNGKFKVPSLRNVALTPPYMHDGRFATLEEVIDNYALGGHGVINEDPNLVPFTLTEDDKRSLVAFLEMLTDTSFVNNPAYKNPFEE